MNKPLWLDKHISLPACRETKRLLKGLGLNTVCREARCPNISECFSQGTAAFMILGDICTRNCRFCGVTQGEPLPPAEDEPRRVREAAAEMRLEYVVITSPTRDDLQDKGSGHFAATVRELRSLPSVHRIEVLIPDFSGDEEALRAVLESGPDVVGHNLETVPSLYKKIRSKAGYNRSLKVLSGIKKYASGIYSKSGLMLGLGEEDEEVRQVLKDLREAGCDFLSIGQYLPPSRVNYPVDRYVLPEKFSFWQEQALAMGFCHCLSGPYVRSSYMAHTYLE